MHGLNKKRNHILSSDNQKKSPPEVNITKTMYKLFFSSVSRAFRRWQLQRGLLPLKILLHLDHDLADRPAVLQVPVRLQLEACRRVERNLLGQLPNDAGLPVELHVGFRLHLLRPPPAQHRLPLVHRPRPVLGHHRQDPRRVQVQGPDPRLLLRHVLRHLRLVHQDPGLLAQEHHLEDLEVLPGRCQA